MMTFTLVFLAAAAAAQNDYTFTAPKPRLPTSLSTLTDGVFTIETYPNPPYPSTPTGAASVTIETYPNPPYTSTPSGSGIVTIETYPNPPYTSTPSGPVASDNATTQTLPNPSGVNGGPPIVSVTSSPAVTTASTTTNSATTPASQTTTATPAASSATNAGSFNAPNVVFGLLAGGAMVMLL